MAKQQLRVAIDEKDYRQLTGIMATLELKEGRHFSYPMTIHWLIEHSPVVKALLPPEFLVKETQLRKAENRVR